MATRRALTALQQTFLRRNEWNFGLQFSRQYLNTAHRMSSRSISTEVSSNESSGLEHDDFGLMTESNETMQTAQIEEDDSSPPFAQAFMNSPDFPIWLAPQRLLPTYNIPVCNLHFRSYSVRHLDFFVDFARRAAFALNMPCSNPIHLPTQISRWTVLKSPFVHKKAQENFERRTHKRLIVIKDAHPDVVDAWLAYLRNDAFYGVGMKATLFRYEKTGFGDRLGEETRGRIRGRQAKKRTIAQEQDSEKEETVASVAERLTIELEKEIANIAEAPQESQPTDQKSANFEEIEPSKSEEDSDQTPSSAAESTTTNAKP